MSIKDKIRAKKAKQKPKSKHASVTVQSLKIADLEPAPYNARTITNEALSGLASSLEEFGLLSFPVVNLRKDGPRLVGGHQRVEILKQQGAETVRCIVVKFNDETERQANFALNNRAIQGEFVPELTRSLLLDIEKRLDGQAQKQFKTLRFDSLMKLAVKQIEHVAGVDDIATAGATQDDYVPGVPKSAVQSEAGAFYQLGEHRVYCGKLEAKGTLQGFESDTVSLGFVYMAHSASMTQAYVDTYIGHMLDNVDGAVYVGTNLVNLAMVQSRFIALGGHWSNTLLWIDQKAKPNDVPYTEVTIPVLYGWKEGALRYYCGSRDHGNVLHLKQKRGKHFPVEIVVNAILNSTKKGDTLLDADLQDGASVIAAQKTGRRLIGYARFPKDCDQIRRRWTAFTTGKVNDWKNKTPEVK